MCMHVHVCLGISVCVYVHVCMNMCVNVHEYVYTFIQRPDIDFGDLFWLFSTLYFEAGSLTWTHILNILSSSWAMGLQVVNYAQLAFMSSLGISVLILTYVL